MKSNRLLPGILLFIWLAIPAIAFGDDNPHTIFEAGNTFYAKGKFTEALKAYRQLVDEGYSSSALYFNAGNAAYKLGDIPSALLYYEKAHKLAPGDEDINFNIRFANLKTTDKIDEAPEFFLASWWRKFILGFSLSTLSVLAVLFVLSASFLLIFYFFTNSVLLKKVSFYTSLSVFFIGLLTIFIAGRQDSYFSGHKQAIIFDATVSVRNAPINSSGTVFILHEGTKVNVLESNSDWLKIRLANGNEGWIKTNSVKEI